MLSIFPGLETDRSIPSWVWSVSKSDLRTKGNKSCMSDCKHTPKRQKTSKLLKTVDDTKSCGTALCVIHSCRLGAHNTSVQKIAALKPSRSIVFWIWSYRKLNTRKKKLFVTCKLYSMHRDNGILYSERLLCPSYDSRP